jgi:hypothetical protein
MGELAYRFLPLDEEEQPRESSQYTITSAQRIDVGSRVEAALLGYTTWEVVEVRSEAGPLLDVRDRFGAEMPFAGTLVCCGVS